MAEKTLAEIIADFTMDLSLDSVPNDVLEHAKRLILDTLGVALVACETEPATIVRDVVVRMDSKPESTLWGTDKKASMADAVLANGTLIHGMEFDDTHVGGIVHPSGVVVNTAITVGEAVGASGKDILAAAICGYEILIRLGLATKGRFHMRGFQTTGVMGSFVASCIAARLLKLPKKDLVNALGICGSQAAALMEFSRDGTWPKKLHAGWPSHCGIYSVLLAEKGFTGPRTIFEGETGIWKSHVGDTEGLMEAFEDLGEVWLTTEVISKMYPVCHYIASFIDITLALREEYGLTADMIDRIECRVDPLEALTIVQPIEAKRRPPSDNAMRYSLPYCIAMAIEKGKVGHQEISPNYLNNPVLEGLMDRVDCIIDENAAVPGHFPGDVKIILKNGKEYHRVQRTETGSAENPLDPNKVIEKFRDNAGLFFSEDKVEKLVQTLSKFEELTKVDDLIADLKII
ncbi:MAG: MmgE/PrpD family protein [Thermacetogeniaceae bacterium]|nr:MmgE/PrpD family protein [Syntrophomonadaceae bacterium]